MRLTPTNQDSNYPVLPKGKYQFEVKNVEYTRSKKNEPMYKIQLRVEGEQDVTVWDYIVENEKNIWKFEQFLKSIDMYKENMDVNPAVMNRTVGSIGECAVSVENNEDFGARNRIERYINVPKKPTTEISSEDLPF